MKKTPGFCGGDDIQREETPYDNFRGRAVRVNIAGGIGLTGNLDTCEIHNNGYLFSLNPSVIYQPDGSPIILEKRSLLESNGNAISVIEIGDTLEDHVSQVAEAITKKEQS